MIGAGIALRRASISLARRSACSARVAVPRALSTDAPLSKTPLYDLHVELGANMVPFAGFSMPLWYAGQSHIDSHKWVRTHAGLFDVSHMCQHRFSGRDATAFLEKVTPSDLAGLPAGSSTLSAFLRPTGGIVDDTIIAKTADNDFYVVTNAGCRDKDLGFFADELAAFGGDVKHEFFDGRGLVALQGPQAAAVLERLTGQDLSATKFGQSRVLTFEGRDLHVARGGYTGEDGFEVCLIGLDADYTTPFSRLLLAENETVKPIGLAARDSLRLEAGMCLYGHDIDETTSPIEASLAWIVSKRRREEANFNGAEYVLTHIREGASKRRVGLTVTGPPAREGSKILDPETKAMIGTRYITSGIHSPTLQKNIAMGYVSRGYTKTNTPVLVEVRGRRNKGQVAKLPFVPAKYYK
ncbi:uncharacterized protein V1510DRAFT_365676 [Dipodascopsis tothii]|uniref:uncharacterized protein n=1 Tax=Dipodascopsis tothii TaxID=44089 RepID=UPI0034CDC0C0